MHWGDLRSSAKGPDGFSIWETKGRQCMEEHAHGESRAMLITSDNTEEQWVEFQMDLVRLNVLSSILNHCSKRQLMVAWPQPSLFSLALSLSLLMHCLHQFVLSKWSGTLRTVNIIVRCIEFQNYNRLRRLLISLGQKKPRQPGG